ncbi:MAG: hypothetical protein MUC87_01985 [Bacteroidia bacterium]|jgi:hypothetical protein|nr:hypothetical protein [Bacteroidia bacterium]
MQLSREIFWDTNYDTINWEQNYQWVICRVLDRGGIEDFRAIRKFYGDKKIIEAAKEARYLSRKTVHFVSAIFNVPLNEFRCYNLMLSQPEQWIY